MIGFSKSQLILLITLYNSNVLSSQHLISSPKFCTSSEDCNKTIGETCWKSYDGCHKGQCQCDLSYSFNAKTVSCHSVKLGGDSCEIYDKCPPSMICMDKKCKCLIGELTHDNLFCLRKNQKILSQSCSLDDACYQRNSYRYINEHTICLNNICQCKEGYKAHKLSCDKWNVLEYGCKENYQCQGGALCKRGQCLCPSNYKPSADNSKCVPNRAKHDLVKGDECDEINEIKYCGSKLICHRCSSDLHSTCVSYDVSPIWAKFSHGVKAGHHSSSLIYYMLIYLTNHYLSQS